MRACPNCGGSLSLNGPQALFVCDYCHNEYLAANEPEYLEYLQAVEKRRERGKRIIRNSLIAIVVIVAAVIAYSLYPQMENEYIEHQRQITEVRKSQVRLPASASDYRGKDAKTVGSELANAGFKKVEFTQIDDVFIIDVYHVRGTIERVSIDGRTDFHFNDWVSKDAKVLISYHCKKGDGLYEPIVSREGQIQISKSAKDCRGGDAEKLVEELRFSGFEDIESKAMDDLNVATGIIWHEGTVGEITVNGETDFDAGSWFPENSHIVVSYHSHPKEESQ